MLRVDVQSVCTMHANIMFRTRLHEQAVHADKTGTSSTSVPLHFAHLALRRLQAGHRCSARRAWR